jgi:mono/diheme cytochrome c family protein
MMKASLLFLIRPARRAGLLGCLAIFSGSLHGTPPTALGVPELKAFFQQNCVRCHGLDGSAVSPEGKHLKGFDFTSAKAMSGKTDQELACTIRKGLFFGLAMPSFKDQLSEADALLLVREVLRKAEKGKAIDPKQ